jgi:hypothetical protein
LREGQRAFAGVGRTTDGLGDRGLVLKGVPPWPVPGLVQDLLARTDRERCVSGKGGGQLKRRVDGGTGRNEPVDQVDLMGGRRR